MKKGIILLLIGLLILGTFGCANDNSKEREETRELQEIRIPGEVNIGSSKTMRITHGLNTDATAEVQIEIENDWIEWEEFEISENVLKIENTKDTNKTFKYVIYATKEY